MVEKTAGNRVIPRLTFKEIVGLNVRLLHVFGNIAPECPNKSWLALYIIYATLFVGFVYTAMLVSEIINMIKVMGDLELMTEAAFLALTHLVQLAKLYAVYRYRGKLRNLIRSIDREEFQPKSIGQYETLKGYILFSKAISKTFLGACIVTCLFWSTYPFTAEGELSLPLAGWFPFDTSYSPNFEIAFLYQAVCSTINGLSNISLDTLMSDKSAIAEHVHTNENHKIDYENIRVLDKTTIYYPRIIRESLEIMKNNNNFNREDGYRLSNTWRLAIPGTSDLECYMYLGMLTSEIINFFVVFGDLNKMPEASFLALTHLIQVTKLYYILKYRTKLKGLISNINRKEFQPRNFLQYTILKGYVIKSKVLSWTFLSAGVLTCCFWGLYPFTERGELFLPLAGWYPFDTSTTPAFEITFVFQFIGSIVNALSNISVDTLMSGLIMVVCAQLSILNDSLKNMRKYAEDELREAGTQEGELSLKLQGRMDEKLIECVVHHRYILEFSNELTFLFTNSILGQFVVSVVIICITLLEITLLPWGSLKFFSLILYQFCMLLEIFLLCYYGNEVIIQVNRLNKYLNSTELTKFAYFSDWTDCSIKFKRNLVIFMTRSQMPLKLYAGGFFTLSLETFVKVLSVPACAHKYDLTDCEIVLVLLLPSSILYTQKICGLKVSSAEGQDILGGLQIAKNIIREYWR
ncbi:hypothetical protein NQ318_012981 [Aromia moschata]|uniref:Odorant receptor n=1 Tax=Aromia moschata TaxID=1265417 RepID=A0AAV8XES8_9CUCU|nr:hypothetical protein NQ318_012981 [Aromia moschata]